MHAKQKLASLHNARELFFKALKAHEHSMYKLGYQDGFNAGWDEAVQRLSQVKPEGNYLPVSNTNDLSALLHQDDGDELSAQDKLIAIIAKAPGLQRHEIVQIARKTLSSVGERTVRSALQRMKNAGELVVADNKWYVADKPKRSLAEN
jgi:hypothetical protein